MLQRRTIDSSLFVRKSIIFPGSDQEGISKLKAALHKRFDIKDHEVFK